MSYYPDCRTDEVYNEKFLSTDDKEFVAGYDWCTEQVVDTFFDNLDAAFGLDSHIVHELDAELPVEMQEEYEFEYDFGNTEPQTRKVKTYGDYFRLKLLEWIEGERNVLITSMLDNEAWNEENSGQGEGKH